MNAVAAGGSLDYTTQYWIYAPTSRAWTAVPDPPGEGDGVCLSGDRIVVLTGAPVSPSLLVFDANGNGEWTRTPADPTVHITWVQVDPPGYPEAITDPRRGVGLLGPGLWTGTELVFPNAGYAYNPPGSSWRELDRVPPGDQPLTVWTGTQIAGYVVAPGGDLSQAAVFSYPAG